MGALFLLFPERANLIIKILPISFAIGLLIFLLYCLQTAYSIVFEKDNQPFKIKLIRLLIALAFLAIIFISIYPIIPKLITMLTEKL